MEVCGQRGCISPLVALMQAVCLRGGRDYGLVVNIRTWLLLFFSLLETQLNCQQLGPVSTGPDAQYLGLVLMAD